jgi:hypothetical protein
VFHVCEDTNTIFEIATWSGSFNGRELQVPVCVVYSVVDGRLYRIDQYGDSAQSEAMVEALVAGGWEKNSPLWTNTAI